MNSPAYEAMLVASARLKLPVRFRIDLTSHDRKSLVAHGNLKDHRFVWALYAHGTHLIWIASGSDTRGGGEENVLVRCVEEEFLPGLHWFAWDGCCFSEARDGQDALRQARSGLGAREGPTCGVDLDPLGPRKILDGEPKGAPCVLPSGHEGEHRRAGSM